MDTNIWPSFTMLLLIANLLALFFHGAVLLNWLWLIATFCGDIIFSMAMMTVVQMAMKRVR